MRYRIRRIDVEPEGLGSPCEGALKETEACDRIVDCKVSDWTPWDSCDKSCGGGQRTREREVIVNPSGGGEPCPERLMETEGCAEEPCASQDCIVSDWSAWSKCSATCGAGFTERAREFTSRPCEDGHGCNQHLREVKPCEDLKECVCNDCLWGDWEEWGTCSSPCDGGQRVRMRHITRSPDPGCKPCAAMDKEQVEGCNMHRCHEKVCVDGVWDDWHPWEPCSASCRGGQTWRVRDIKVEANDCGQPAVGLAVEHRACNLDVPCVDSQDCEFDDWDEWSSCSGRCSGLKRRHRQIKTHGRGDGAFCEGPLEHAEPCQIVSGVRDWLEPSMYLDVSRLSHMGFAGAEPALFRYLGVAEVDGQSVDLAVVPKNTYTGCDLETNGAHGQKFGAINVASGTSVRLALRLENAETGEPTVAKQLTVKVFDLDTGLAGMSRESVHARGFMDYRMSAHTSIEVEAELSDLTRFKATRYGTDDDDPVDPMDATETQEAKTIALYYEGVSEVELTFEVGVGSFCKTFLFAIRACFSGDCHANACEKAKHEPVDCELSDWSKWGPCDATCGVGQRVRSREVVRPPAYGGRPCSDALSETGKCMVKECDQCKPMNCSWEEWGPWSQCDRCDGEMRRFRHISAHASCGGNACAAGDAEEITNCSRSCHERVYCEWADWQAFGACSATCGKGLRSRTRYLKALAAPQRESIPKADVAVAKFEQLTLRTQRLRSARLQVLALAFAAGCISLMPFAVLVGRRAQRQRAERYRSLGNGRDA